MSNNLKPENNTRYLALSFDIKKEQKKAVGKNLSNQLNTALSSLIDSGEIEDVSVIFHNKTAERHGRFEVWSHLILMKISRRDMAPCIMEHLENMGLASFAKIIRIEELITTPDSTYLIPGEKAKKRGGRPFYAVEYVEVQEEYKKEFQNIMISNNGPAMRYIMEQKSWCYNFLALETETVYFQNPGYPAWNQIHVIGLYLDSLIWYKKDFSRGLELANHISFEDNFKRLKEIRIMRYKSMGKMLSKM